MVDTQSEIGKACLQSHWRFPIILLIFLHTFVTHCATSLHHSQFCGISHNAPSPTPPKKQFSHSNHFLSHCFHGGGGGYYHYYYYYHCYHYYQIIIIIIIIKVIISLLSLLSLLSNNHYYHYYQSDNIIIITFR